MRLPLENCPGTSLPQPYVDLFRSRPTRDVELPDGTAAVAVTRLCDVRTVLSDSRFSRSQSQMRTPWGGSWGSDLPLALASSDPPTHTRRRRAIQRWFTARRAEQSRPLIERVANQLIDDLVSTGSPADIVAGYCHPLPNLAHMTLLGLDPADLPYLVSRISVAWSCSGHAADEVAEAAMELRDYFTAAVARPRRGGTGATLVDSLVGDKSEDRLTDAEIVMLTMGLFMSGAETTSNHLALGLVEVLRHPGLPEMIRDDPGQIPSVVEELLRWIWFGGEAGGSGGRAHVATADVQLHDRLVVKGEVVVPVNDVANRDPDVFPQADAFCPHRSPNPHVGFGHGRHRCAGMSLARVELQVGLHTLFSRLDGLAIASQSQIDWRTQMFTRGIKHLPVTWRGGST